MASFVEATLGRSMILFSRPDFDPVTKYLSAWSGYLIEEAKVKSIRVLDLFGAKANKKEVVGRLKKLQPPLVVLNGHGNNRFVAGQDNEPIIEAGKNAHVLAGSVIYAVSCNSAMELGKEAGLYSDTAYIGYEKKFSFMHRHGFFSHPEDDPVTRPFMDFSNQVVMGLMKGHTAKESVKRAKM